MSSDEEEDEGARPRFGGKRSREDAMLGVFGDESDEEERGGGGSSSRGRGGGDKRPLAAKPVSFVSTGTAAPTPMGPSLPPPRPPRRPAPGHADGLPAEKVDKDFGSFEKNGSGFGSRMLQKMGWVKGRAIGKSAQGVVNPIEARLRPTGLGLGFGGYHETTAKAKQQQKRILHAGDGAAAAADDDDDDDSDDEHAAARRKAKARAKADMATAQGPSAQEPRVQHWKKHERRELKVKSAAELRAQWAAAEAVGGGVGGVGGVGGAVLGVGGVGVSVAPNTAPILDLRGPQAKLHASITSALLATPHGAAADDRYSPTAAYPAQAAGVHQLPNKGEFLPELKHNLRMAVEMAEADLERKHRALRAEREVLAALVARRDVQAGAMRQVSGPDEP